MLIRKVSVFSHATFHTPTVVANSRKMIKTFIRRLFFMSDKKRNEIIKDLKSNPSFRTKEEIQKHGTDSDRISNIMLEKGKVESITVPDLGNQKGLILTKWYFKSGDIVKKGDIVCDIENENIRMEFESFFSGKILLTSNLKAKLTSGTEICKIERI